jgi:hypothetical protein
MTGRTLALGAAAALLLAAGAYAQTPPSDPDRPSTPGKSPPTRTAPVMGGTVRNGNAAVQDSANMGQSSDAAARTAIDARRRACALNPPTPGTKAWRKCEAVGAAPPS